MNYFGTFPTIDFPEDLGSVTVHRYSLEGTAMWSTQVDAVWNLDGYPSQDIHSLDLVASGDFWFLRTQKELTILGANGELVNRLEPLHEHCGHQLHGITSAGHGNVYLYSTLSQANSTTWTRLLTEVSFNNVQNINMLPINELDFDVYMRTLPGRGFFIGGITTNGEPDIWRYGVNGTPLWNRDHSDNTFNVLYCMGSTCQEGAVLCMVGSAMGATSYRLVKVDATGNV